MTVRKHPAQFGSPTRGAFLIPMAWIVGLLACYWLLTDWQSVPGLISEALTALP